MNREILFRGKRKLDGKWIFGSLITDAGDYGDAKYIVPHGEEDKMINWSYCDCDTVGQYTGLKDKNGVKIFEGDVLQSVNGIGYVVWDGTGFALKSPGSEAVDWHPSAYYKTMEIIGNIHDNPELL